MGFAFYGAVDPVAEVQRKLPRGTLYRRELATPLRRRISAASSSLRRCDRPTGGSRSLHPKILIFFLQKIGECVKERLLGGVRSHSSPPKH